MNEEIQRALDAIRQGGIILYPTETVWGLGCDATNVSAVGKIFALKRRADSKAMIMLLDKADNVVKYVKHVPEVAWELWEVADKPLTLILPEGCSVAENLLPEEKTIAIRLTTNEFCQQLIQKMGRPLVSTSANISGEPTPQSFADISDQIKNGVDYVVNESMASGAVGVPSSIIKLGASGEIEIIRK